MDKLIKILLGEEKKPECKTVNVETLVSEIPLEGIIGIIVQASKGLIAPRWLCMNKEGKEKYMAIGNEFVAKFMDEEIKAKIRRDENDPFISLFDNDLVSKCELINKN